ncbi:hypothetical protein C8Q79DRAFT_1015220 [Trametes meyenii]|nr:hypothetical protein C8Q79DRAFT_1015220 [Trametes meyenii]
MDGNPAVAPPLLFFLFLRNPRTRLANRRRRLRGFPDEGPRAEYTTHNRDHILSTINRVLQDGIQDLFPALSILLAPRALGIYQTHAPAAAFRARALFIWRRVPQHLCRRIGGEFVVAIFVPTTPPLSVAHFAFILLNLTYRSIHSFIEDYYFDPTNIPRLKNLAYALTPSAVHAIAVFSNIGAAYEEVLSQAIATPATHFCDAIRAPLSVWPPDECELLNPDVVLESYTQIRALATV